MTLTTMKPMKKPCVRCGTCCKNIPCMQAQIRYGITENNIISKPCPELKCLPDGTYKCLWIERDGDMQFLMLGGGCTFPKEIYLKRVL